MNVYFEETLKETNTIEELELLKKEQLNELIKLERDKEDYDDMDEWEDKYYYYNNNLDDIREKLQRIGDL